MYNKTLRQLDDRIYHLSQLEDQREIGRLEGYVRGLEMSSYCRGEIDAPPEEFKRTRFKRLQKHLTREYYRLQKQFNK